MMRILMSQDPYPTTWDSRLCCISAYVIGLFSQSVSSLTMQTLLVSTNKKKQPITRVCNRNQHPTKYLNFWHQDSLWSRQVSSTSFLSSPTSGSSTKSRFRGIKFEFQLKFSNAEYTKSVLYNDFFITMSGFVLREQELIW